MPRPALSDAQIAGARARILIEAARIVSAEGFGALSMRRLAKAVGLTAGALYRYFPTKQHVLLAYCVDALDRLTRELKEIVAQEDDPLRALERMLIAYGDFALKDADRFRVLFLDPEANKLELDDPGGLDGYRLLQEVAAKARSSGSLRPLPVEDISRILLASVHGVCVLAATVRDIDFSDARALVREAARNAVRGLSIRGDMT